MIKKTLWVLILLAGTSLGGLSSCSKDGTVKPDPSLVLVHLGTNEDSPDVRTLYTGEPVHFEVKISAPGLIQKIDLEIRQKSGYGNYTIKKEYTTGYVGLKEIRSFQDQLDLVEDMALGDYAFELKVTDQNGRVGSIESNVTIKSGDGEGGGHQHEH